MRKNIILILFILGFFTAPSVATGVVILNLYTLYFAVIAVAAWVFFKYPKRTVQLIGLLIVILAIGSNLI